MENLSFNKENLAYERASKRVKELKGFYGNLTSYCLVIPFLLVINLLTSPSELWFYWPMLGWGNRNRRSCSQCFRNRKRLGRKENSAVDGRRKKK